VDVFEADWAFLRRTVAGLIADLDRRLAAKGQLRLGAGDALRVHAREALSVVERVVAETNSALEGDLGPRGRRRALTKLRRMILVSRALMSSTRALEPHDAELGLGGRYFLGDLARTLVADDVDFIEWPVDEPQFATRSWPFHGLLRRYEHDEDIRKSGARPMLVIYPRREAANVLLLPVLVHELGHPAADENALVDKVVAELTTGEAWETARAKLITAIEETGVPHEYAVQNADNTLNEVLEEALCDALATACLGPSFLLAFSGWVTAMSLEEWRLPHPTTAQRIRLIRDQLKETGWTLLEASIKRFDDWLEGLSTSWEQRTDSQEALSDALSAAAAAIRRVAVSHAGAAAFSPGAHDDQLTRGLADAFADGVLPAQLNHEGEHADLRSILLGGWIQGLTEQGGGPAALSQVLAARDQQAFLDKGLEMATLLRTWKR
jgi:hypothetical protein